jgi:hypothetical protein
MQRLRFEEVVQDNCPEFQAVVRPFEFFSHVNL